MERTSNSTAWMNVSEIQLVYKPKIKASERPKVLCSKEAYALFLETWDHNKLELIEQFKVLLLNRGSKVLGLYEVSTGGIHGTVADPKLIFAAALIAGASSIILAHNHPSSCLQPSRVDELLTDKIKAGGVLLDIKVMDHLIISPEGYYSFLDQGRL